MQKQVNKQMLPLITTLAMVIVAGSMIMDIITITNTIVNIISINGGEIINGIGIGKQNIFN
jgi:hypothetical protein